MRIRAILCTLALLTATAVGVSHSQVLELDTTQLFKNGAYRRKVIISLAWQLESYEEAVPLLQQMVKEGDYSRVALLGEAYERGLGGVDPDTAQAIKLYTMGAERNDLDAQFRLGVLLSKMDGQARRGHYWLQKAMEGGSGEAANYLGLLAGLEGEYEQSIRLHRKAVALAYKPAGFIVCVLLEMLYDLEKYAEEGTRYLKIAAADGESDACRLLGMRYETGYGTPRSYAQARAWYDTAILYSQGLDSIALQRQQHCIDVLNRHGSDAKALRQERKIDYFAMRYTNEELLGIYKTAIDENRHNDANRLLNIALERGSERAMLVQAEIYLRGFFGVPKDCKKGIQLLARSAQMGEPAALFRLGNMYANGECDIKPRDPKRAVEYYELAAKIGHAESYLRLGMHHEAGDGVPRSYATAIKWYDKAAKQGEEKAQERLKACKAKLNRPPRNDVHYVLGLEYTAKELIVKALLAEGYEKIIYLEAAADLGDNQAQTLLGRAYYNGEKDLPRDFEKALYWFRKAANAGNPDASFHMGLFYHLGYGGVS